MDRQAPVLLLEIPPWQVRRPATTQGKVGSPDPILIILSIFLRDEFVISSPGMMFSVNLPDFFCCEVSVNLGSGNIAVA